MASPTAGRIARNFAETLSKMADWPTRAVPQGAPKGRAHRAGRLASRGAVAGGQGGVAPGRARSFRRGRASSTRCTRRTSSSSARRPVGDDARLAVDGRDDTAWTGRPGEMQWTVVGGVRPPGAGRAPPGALRRVRDERRAHRVPLGGAPGARAASACPPMAATSDEALGRARRTPAESPNPAVDFLAQPTRRSWFVDANACGLRLVVDRTNAGPPVVREVQAIESARDVLRDGEASDDGAFPGFWPRDAIDGTYGRAGRARPASPAGRCASISPKPQPIDRVRLVLGFDATSVAAAGRGPQLRRWRGRRSTTRSRRARTASASSPIASEPLRADGTILPLRRRLVTLSEPRTRPRAPPRDGRRHGRERPARRGRRARSSARSPRTAPTTRAPSSPRRGSSASTRTPRRSRALTPGGEVTNDAYHAKFLQGRFAPLLPALRATTASRARSAPSASRSTRRRATRRASVLESIEGDDPLLDAQLLVAEQPPAHRRAQRLERLGLRGGDRARSRATRSAGTGIRCATRALGGMGQLAPAVRRRVGAVPRASAAARRSSACSRPSAATATRPTRTFALIDRVLRRTSGRPIRGFAPPIDVERAWPSDPHPPRAKVSSFRTTRSSPTSPARSAARPTQALPGVPRRRASGPTRSSRAGRSRASRSSRRAPSAAPDVVAASPRDGVFPNPSGPGWCDTVPEAFRSTGGAAGRSSARSSTPSSATSRAPAPGDPPESVADARLFFAAAYEQMVDAYVRLAP